jgi:Ni,Fe-hydrogenase I large subunit
MMQKLMLGEKIDDELAKFKVDFANTNLNTVTALYKQSSETLQKLAEMQMNAQYKAFTLNYNKQRADAATKQANLKEKQYNQKQQDEAEKKKIKQEANHAAAEYDKAKARGDKKAMAYWRARYTELTGQEPPGEKSSSSKSVIGTPSLNFDTTLLTQEK